MRMGADGEVRPFSELHAATVSMVPEVLDGVDHRARMGVSFLCSPKPVRDARSILGRLFRILVRSDH